MHPKSTRSFMYPIPNCLHRQPENHPIASIVSAVLIAHRISYLLGGTHSAYEAWRKIQKQNVRGRLADRGTLEILENKRGADRREDKEREKKRQSGRERSCIFMHLSERMSERTTEREERARGRRERET